MAEVEAILNRLAEQHPVEFVEGALQGHDMGIRLHDQGEPYKAPWPGLCDADIEDFATRYEAHKRGEEVYWPDTTDEEAAGMLGQLVGYIAMREELESKELAEV